MSETLTHIEKKINLVPELRFKEFEDEYENVPYGSVFTFHPTNSYSRENLNYDFGEVYNIHYGDIHTKFQTMFDIDREEVPFINSDLDTSKIKNDCYCKEGDLVIADASEDYSDIGKTIEIVNLSSKKVVAGLHTFLARPSKREMIIGFSGYLVQTWKVRKQVMTIAQGTKVLGISTGRLSTIELSIPSLPEQQKLAAFLSAVDQKIQLLTGKKELLEQYKKGVMQQLFSQQIRFKDANGKEFPEWEWVGGNLLFDNISDKNHNSDLPILAITQDQGAIPRDLINYEMTVSDSSIASYKVVQVGDFVISLRTFQGGIEYSNYHGICSPAYIILRPSSDKVDRTFYKFYLKTDRYIRQLQRTLEGIRDGKMISYKYFSEIKLPFPSLKEQQKISSFIEEIENRIQLANKELIQAQTFKKGLLQKMFV